jgi:hypothetical protein
VSGADANSNGDEFWLVNLTAGDALTINFSPGHHFGRSVLEQPVALAGDSDRDMGLEVVGQTNSPGSGYQLQVVSPASTNVTPPTQPSPKSPPAVPTDLKTVLLPPPYGFVVGKCRSCGPFNILQYAARNFSFGPRDIARLATSGFVRGYMERPSSRRRGPRRSTSWCSRPGGLPQRRRDRRLQRIYARPAPR